MTFARQLAYDVWNIILEDVVESLQIPDDIWQTKGQRELDYSARKSVTRCLVRLSLVNRFFASTLAPYMPRLPITLSRKDDYIQYKELVQDLSRGQRHIDQVTIEFEDRIDDPEQTSFWLGKVADHKPIIRRLRWEGDVPDFRNTTNKGQDALRMLKIPEIVAFGKHEPHWYVPLMSEAIAHALTGVKAKSLSIFSLASDHWDAGDQDYGVITIPGIVEHLHVATRDMNTRNLINMLQSLTCITELSLGVEPFEEEGFAELEQWFHKNGKRLRHLVLSNVCHDYGGQSLEQKRFSSVCTAKLLALCPKLEILSVDGEHGTPSMILRSVPEQTRALQIIIDVQAGVETYAEAIESILAFRGLPHLRRHEIVLSGARSRDRLRIGDHLRTLPFETSLERGCEMPDRDLS